MATGMEARTLVAVVNEAPVALQSRDLSEAAAECSSLTAPANKETSFVYRDKRGFFVVSCVLSWYNLLDKSGFAVLIT